MVERRHLCELRRRANEDGNLVSKLRLERLLDRVRLRASRAGALKRTLPLARKVETSSKPHASNAATADPSSPAPADVDPPQEGRVPGHENRATRRAVDHVAPGLGRLEAESLIQAMRVRRGEEDLAKPELRGVGDRSLREHDAEAATAMLLEDEQVGEPSERRLVGDEPGEARLEPSGAYGPKTIEPSIERSTTSRSTPADQYAVRRKVQIASMSRRDQDRSRSRSPLAPWPWA